MSVYIKPFLVLLLSVLIFAGIALLTNGELVDFIQTRFYNPSVINSFVKENSKDAEISQNLIMEYQEKFAHTLEAPAVRGSFHYNQNPQDIFERSRIYGVLLESTVGLQSVQFVDGNGARMYYSTSYHDIINQTGDSVAYRNYTEDSMAMPFDMVSVSASEKAKYTMDTRGERIVFSFPFIDSMDVYRGTALFNVSIGALAQKLISEGRIKVNEDVSVISSPPGIIFGSPASSRTDFFDIVTRIWNDGKQGRITLEAVDSNVNFSLISFKTGGGLFFGRLVNDALFSIPDSMKLTLYLSIFLTIFLTLFFITSFRPSSVTMVKTRLAHLKENLFNQLYLNKSSQERAKWILELEQRREEIHAEMTGNLKITRRSKKSIDSIIDGSWDELLALLKAGSHETVVTPASAGTITKTGMEKTGAKLQQETPLEDEEIGEIEEMEEIDETDEEGIIIVEDVEEIGEAEEIDEEEIGEVEEIEEIAEAEEISEEEELSEIEANDEPLEIKIPTESKTKIEPEKTPTARRGLLALASEIEFSIKYPEGPFEYEDDGKDLDAELDIVSPFASMFSSLKEKKAAKNKKQAKKRGAAESKKPAKKRAAKKESTDKKPAKKRSPRKKKDGEL